MTSNQTLYQQAKSVIPGGVNSPVRAFNGVGGTPIFIDHAKGAYLFDSNQKHYIDYVLSWGPMILGHAHPHILEAVIKAAEKGLSFGAPTEIETKMAERLCSLLPSMDQVRMVNSGTEATMSAIRLARGHTGRDVIVKFEGCYHGHGDSLLVKAGSGALTLGVPSSPGVPADLAKYTITLSYNDSEAIKQLFSERGEEIAAIIVEPVAGNMNLIPASVDFLTTLRSVCDQYQSILIFDEVMTGFRVSLQGAQGYYRITPDLTTLGKVIGAGMPVGAFGGKRDIMQSLAPVGPVYQAGTLSGNPVAMAAGLAMLDLITVDGFYEALTQKTQQLLTGIEAAAQNTDIALCTQSCGSMFGIFFTDAKRVETFAQVQACNIQRFKQFFHAMLKEGIYLAPSAYEAGFMSSAHSNDDIAYTIAAAQKVLQTLN